MILKLLIDMDARGNKLSLGKIPDQYLKNKKLLNFQNSGNFDLKRRKSSEYKIVLNTKKMKCFQNGSQ